MLYWDRFRVQRSRNMLHWAESPCLDRFKTFNWPYKGRIAFKFLGVILRSVPFTPGHIVIRFKFQVECAMHQIDMIDLIIGTAFGVAVLPSFITAEHCNLYSISMSYNGRYCPSDGTVIPQLSPRQCKHVCLQSRNCKAYNYNFYFTMSPSFLQQYDGVCSVNKNAERSVLWVGTV